MDRLRCTSAHLPGRPRQSQVRQEVSTDPENRAQEQRNRCRRISEDHLYDEPDRGEEQSRRGQYQFFREKIGDASSRQQKETLLVAGERQPESTVQPVPESFQALAFRMRLPRLGNGSVQDREGVRETYGGTQGTHDDQQGTGTDHHSRHHEGAQGVHLSSP